MVRPELDWYRSWFDEDYLTLYAHRDDRDAFDQLELIRCHAKPSCSETILDLGCGAGRHLEIMRQWGWRAAGLDLSMALLREARIRESGLPLIKGDMRSIPGCFDLILSLFTSFGYFDDHEQNLLVFDAVSRSLKEGGRFWLDFLNPLYVRAHICEKETIRTKDGLGIEIRRRVQQGKVIKEIDMGSRRVVESVWLYDADDLARMGLAHHLRVRKLFGDYQGGVHEECSSRTIMLMEKDR